MAFQIAARTLLELGAELIGSDGAALYELVKNAVDASIHLRTPRVRIRIQNVFSHARYLQALETLAAQEMPLDTIRRDIESRMESDAPGDARRQFLRLLADAAGDRAKLTDALVQAYTTTNFIDISDDGEGMSLVDLQQIYLTIGTRSRRREKEKWRSASSSPRPLLGDKGVGRLSVMRLGDHLKVTTTRAGERYWNVLEIDWTQFSHDSDALLQDIEISPKRGQRKDDPNVSGTTIHITQLRSDWDRGKFKDLIEVDFARMVDPFDRQRANRLFRIYYNGEQQTIPQMAVRLSKLAHAVVTCRFGYDKDGHATFAGEVDYRLHEVRHKTLAYDEVQLVAMTRSKTATVIRTLGPFELEFLWFNRRYLTADAEGSLEDVRDLVRQWGGGLMVFRDGFRIQPYGGPDDDWLHLDKKAFARKGFKLNRQQLIGRVSLSWRNEHLVEQTNREGLVDNDHKAAFVAVLKKVLEDFKQFSDSIDKDVKQEALTSVEVLKMRVAQAKTDVQKRIRQIAADVPAQARPLQEVERLVQQLAKHIEDADAIIEDYKDEREKFVHLAGIGLMVEFILHELSRATSNTLGTLESVDARELPGRLPSVFETLEQQLKTLQKRLQTLDPLSTARRHVKEVFDVRAVVQQIVDARGAEQERHGIKVTVTGGDDPPFKIRGVKGMLIQVIENLFANAFYWLKQERIVDPSLRPRVDVHIDGRHRTVTVTDNGPGVEPRRAEEIFEPFVTSKPPGEGSGLGLYIARDLCRYHGWSLRLDEESTGRDGRLRSFVLNASPAEGA